MSRLARKGYSSGCVKMGILIKRQGTDYNMPTQRSMEMGLFEIKEGSYTNGNQERARYISSISF